jgi:DNA-directed RNA polymerase subunit RPC12/RpoP
MDVLVCRACGRRVDAEAASSDQGRDDRRCPRCGASLAPERRHMAEPVDREQRRMERDWRPRDSDGAVPPDDPGAPG